METIFDFLRSILFSKKRISINEDNKTAYVPFLINRWGSFYSKELCNLINITTNRFSNFTKEEHYLFLYNMLPKNKFLKIDYIKKKGKEKENTKEDDNILMLAKNLELSKREINQYILCQQSQ